MGRYVRVNGLGALSDQASDQAAALKVAADAIAANKSFFLNRYVTVTQCPPGWTLYSDTVNKTYLCAPPGHTPPSPLPSSIMVTRIPGSTSPAPAKPPPTPSPPAPMPVSTPPTPAPLTPAAPPQVSAQPPPVNTANMFSQNKRFCVPFLTAAPYTKAMPAGWSIEPGDGSRSAPVCYVPPVRPPTVETTSAPPAYLNTTSTQPAPGTPATPITPPSSDQISVVATDPGVTTGQEVFEPGGQFYVPPVEKKGIPFWVWGLVALIGLKVMS